MKRLTSQIRLKTKPMQFQSFEVLILKMVLKIERTQELLGEARNALQDGALQRVQLAPLVVVRQRPFYLQERLQLLPHTSHPHKSVCSAPCYYLLL